MKMSLHIAERELLDPFRIAGWEWTHSRHIVVTLMEDGIFAQTASCIEYFFLINVSFRSWPFSGVRHLWMLSSQKGR